MPVNADIRNLARDGRFSSDDASALRQLVKDGKVTQDEAKDTLSRYGDIMDPEAGRAVEGFTGGSRTQQSTGLPASTVNNAGLKPGAQGDDVKALQHGLMSLSMRDQNASMTLPSGADGKYGDETKAAVSAFQRANKLPETGTADPNTLKTLDQRLRTPTPSAQQRPTPAQTPTTPATTATTPKPARGLQGSQAPAPATTTPATTTPATTQPATTQPATTQPAAPAPATDAQVKGKVGDTHNAYAGPYQVNGKSVEAPAAFRMAGGINQPTPEQAMKLQSDTIRKAGQWPKDTASAKKLDAAITHCSYGRGSPDEVKSVTQKLIDSGALAQHQAADPKTGAVPDDATAIRRMQWANGVGVDCNGTCREQYKALHGGKSPTKSWGDELIEVKKDDGTSLNPNFAKVDPMSAKPGDVIKLRDVTGDVGHYVTVENVATARSGRLKAMTVTSSFGAGGDPDNVNGGVHKETWVYDEKANKWGTLNANRTITWSTTDGPYQHDLVGVYRSADPPSV